MKETTFSVGYDPWTGTTTVVNGSSGHVETITNDELVELDDDEASADDERREEARKDWLQNVCLHAHAGTADRCPECDEVLQPAAELSNLWAFYAVGERL